MLRAAADAPMNRPGRTINLALDIVGRRIEMDVADDDGGGEVERITMIMMRSRVGRARELG